jgi:hypothetical protein
MSSAEAPSPSSTTDPRGRENQSIANFAASLSTAAIIFGVQIGFFLILSGNWKLHRSEKGLNEKPTERQSLFHRI